MSAMIAENGGGPNYETNNDASENGVDASILHVLVSYHEEEYRVTVPRDATVSQLQEEIYQHCFESQARFLPHSQLLYFNNELLQASETLTSYGIQNDSPILLRFWIRVWITTSTHRASVMCHGHSTVRQLKETIGGQMYQSVGYDSEIPIDRMRLLRIPNRVGFLADQGVLHDLGIGDDTELNLSVVGWLL